MNSRRLWRIAAAIMAVLVFAVALLTLIPFAETNIWWIRYLDFPRVQFVVALLVLLALYGALRRLSGRSGWLTIALDTVAIGYNIYRIHPYARALDERAVEVAECQQGSRIRILVANVQQGNRQSRRLIDTVNRIEPDLFLAMETDEWWDREMQVLADQFPYQIEFLPQEREHYGIHLLSRLELIESEIEFIFGQETPAVFSSVRLPNGEAVGFQGLHPQPPLYWSQPTTMRDARLLSAALRARDASEPVIMAGDFNAVPWERVTQRAMRIGGFIDPREGRGLYPTYDAKSPFISWPLDHVLFQKHFALVSFERLPELDSDHHPVLAELCYMHPTADLQSPPPLAAGDLEEAETSLEAARTAAEDRS